MVHQTFHSSSLTPRDSGYIDLLYKTEVDSSLILSLTGVFREFSFS